MLCQPPSLPPPPPPPPPLHCPWHPSSCLCAFPHHQLNLALQPPGAASLLQSDARSRWKCSPVKAESLLGSLCRAGVGEHKRIGLGGLRECPDSGFATFGLPPNVLYESRVNHVSDDEFSGTASWFEESASARQEYQTGRLGFTEDISAEDGDGWLSTEGNVPSHVDAGGFEIRNSLIEACSLNQGVSTASRYDKESAIEGANSRLTETEDDNGLDHLRSTEVDFNVMSLEEGCDNLSVNGMHSGLLTKLSCIGASDDPANDVHKLLDDNRADTFANEIAEEPEFYDPQPGDIVFGVVVSDTGVRLSLDIGAKKRGYMLAKDMLPFSQNNFNDSLNVFPNSYSEEQENIIAPSGKCLIVSDENANSVFQSRAPPVDAGTVVMAEVLGKTWVTGTPLLSSRRVAMRIALHRVKQLQQEHEPIEVEITQWNAGGLVCSIEGLLSFVPKGELLQRIESNTVLKEYVGKRMSVMIIGIESEGNSVIASESKAWEWKHIRPGMLVNGTVGRLFHYGIQVLIDKTKLRGMVHISHVSNWRVANLNNLFSVGENVKVMVIKSPFPDRIAFSFADLESERGLILKDKERVFQEAEDRARLYRESLSPEEQVPEHPPHLDYDIEFQDPIISNWRWLGF